METFIGIDIGTSSAKFLLADESGRILSVHSESYKVIAPKEGWSEQNPEDWFEAADRGIPALLRGQNSASVRGISFGGQMHGLVALDKSGNVIRPCILWNDGRTEKQTEYLNTVIGREKLTEYTANIAFAGFTAPKLLWLKENEPENFKRICAVLLPKDYLTYRFTGEYATDYSDASGTLLLDVKNRRWSAEMCRICGVKSEWLPRIYESFQPVGKIKKELAVRWGLRQDVAVAAGAGDNAAAAVGTGTVSDGSCNISLGTSGTVFIPRGKFVSDGGNALHSFCHATGGYHLMGCILSAAACNSWWMDILGTKDFEAEQRGAEELLGKNNLYFLPYLMGERSPHNDVNARGAFIGIGAETSRRQMTLAVMEGVAYALKDCVEAARRGGTEIASATICGGGAKSGLWRSIIANVLNIPVCRPTAEEGPAYGAAILAMVACGSYDNLSQAVNKIVKKGEAVLPEEDISYGYLKRYEIFKRLYPALKGVYNKI